MPAGVRPPGFHGKKGRSGRKCYRDEQLRIQVIEKAWLKKQKKMNEQEATQIVLRDMTQKTDITSGGEKIIPIYGGQSIQEHNSPKKDIQLEEEDKGGDGGNERL